MTKLSNGYLSLSWLALGSLAGLTLGSCGLVNRVPAVDSVESAQAALEQSILPKINVRESYIDPVVASRYAVDAIEDPLPNIQDFPLHRAGATQDSDTIRLEILSSSEKANINRQNERWLVDVASRFNQENLTLDSGERIQVEIRQIASGTAARLLGAEAIEPEGYSPSNDFWIAMLREEGIPTTVVVPQLLPNTAGWVVQKQVYDRLTAQGEATFEGLLGQILAGNVSVGYPNPYSSSTSLNLLYTLFWQAADLPQTDGSLTLSALQSPVVNSVFTSFQQQVLISTPTTLDLQEIFIRDPDKLQAFPLEYQNYQALVTLPNFTDVAFIPFGIPHNNPLVGFGWNTPQEQAALERFGAYASSEPMRSLAIEQGFVETDYSKNSNQHPPMPSGEILRAAQSYWKGQKDAGRTVYLMLVVDVSGSMSGSPIRAVQEGLRVASTQINSSNQVGMIAFNERPTYLLPLAPFDIQQHQGLLAAIDQLRADGLTATHDALMVAVADLMKQANQDPDGIYYVLLLSDGETNRGFRLNDTRAILEYSNVRVYPIAYGSGADRGELESIAALRESVVQVGTVDNVQTLLKDLLQTNL